MRLVLSAVVLSLSGTSAVAQQPPAAVDLLANKVDQYRTCVVEKAVKAGMTSKQSADDVASAFLDDCDYDKLLAFAVQAAKATPGGSSDDDAQVVGQQFLDNSRVQVQAVAKAAVVKARVKAGL